MVFSKCAARVVVCVSFFISASAFAVPISLFGTGLDSSGNVLAGGSSDANFTVLETGNAAQILNYTAPYAANDAFSQWIWENANGQPSNVTRTFRTTFDLTGLDESTAVIAGMWGTDNIGVDILINGISTGNSLGGVITGNFTSLHAFTINSGFQAGVNTLDFIVQDAGSISAFRASLSGEAEMASVPEPASLGLLLLGIAGVFYSRRKV